MKITISDRIIDNSINEPDKLSVLSNIMGLTGIDSRTDNIIDNDNLDLLEQYENAVKKYKLNIVSVHAPFKNQDISSEDEHFRKKSIRNIEKSILIADRLQASYVTVHCSGKIENNADNKKLLENAIKSLDEIKIMADVNDITLLVENTIENMICHSIDEMKYIAEKGFSLCFDYGHANIISGDPTKFYNAIKDDVKIIHFHTNNGKKDEHNFDEQIFRTMLDSVDNNTIVELEPDNQYISIEQITEILKTL